MNHLASSEIAQAHIRLVPFNDITLSTQRRYLVKDLIPRTGLVIVWGPPKSGKSFWVFDIAMHIALGWKYRDKRVQEAAVIYCAFEGQTGVEARVEAFRQRSDIGNVEVPFYLQPATLNLVADHKKLISAIQGHLGEEQPGLVVLDTLNRSFTGSENSDQDMGAYIQAGDAIRETFECAVLIVHHCGIEGTRPRGHTSLTGAADAQLSVKKDAAGNILVTVEAMKDGAEGEVISSALEKVEVGVDEDGEPITSCIVVKADRVVNLASGKRLSASQSLALMALNNLCVTGKPVKPEWQLPGKMQMVELDVWRKELLSRSVIEKDGKNPSARWKELQDRMASRGLIGIRDGWVWSCSQP